MVKHGHGVGLKKELGLWQATIYGIGIILGAGIYAIIGEAAAMSGNALWISIILTALIASFSGLSYAELSSMYSTTAAEFNYTKKAFKRNWLAFMVGWTIIIAFIISSATVSLGFAGYFSHIFASPMILVALVLVMLLSIINFIGIKESARFNTISTIIEFVGLVIIVALGASSIGIPSIDYFETPTQDFLPSIIGAIGLMMFAFLGFESVANMSEETKNATKVIPKALLLSLSICTILYILVALSAVSISGWETLAHSKAPLTQVAEHGFERYGVDALQTRWVYSIIALFATGNTILVMLIVASRMIYGISRDGFLPQGLSKLHKKRRTPHIAIFIVALFTCLTALIGSLKIVASMTDIALFIAYFSVNMSLIWLRLKHPRIHRPFRVPVNIRNIPVTAILGAVTCFFMIFHFPIEIILAQAGILLLGYMIYIFYGRKHSKI